MTNMLNVIYITSADVLNEGRGMNRNEGWLLADLFKLLRQRRTEKQSQQPVPEALDQLLAACEVLMSDVGEASVRAVATSALSAYQQLTEEEQHTFFRHMLDDYGVDDDALTAAYHHWERTRGHAELVELFTAVEPARQQLLRRMNHAPDATLALVNMRADLRRLQKRHPRLRPLDQDFHHLLVSWFNRGFLRMEEITWDSPKELHQHLLQYEKVHPMSGRSQLRRRLQPKDRRCYAFFHPATGEVPLIFVEVALVRGVPSHMGPLLEPGPTLTPAKADTAALYSINNSLEGLAGVSFGSFLIKQVIEQVEEELPHLENFVTLSPIPGFRSWLEAEAGAKQRVGDTALTRLRMDLEQFSGPEGAKKLDDETAEDIRARLLPVLARYVADERGGDGRPVDPVARFHLGNGATAWQLHWPANTAEYAWNQSYGAMINYRYQPDVLEEQHEEFVRRRSVALGDQFRELLADARDDTDPDADPDTTPEKGTGPMSEDFTTIYGSFAAQSEARPDKPLFELPGGDSITYAQAQDRVHQIAAKLTADGVTPGDRVAMQVEKSPEAISLYLATLQIGGIFLPLNTAYTGKEMDYFIADASPRVLVCTPEAAQEHQHREASGTLVETLGTDGDGSLLSEDGRHTEVYDAGVEDPAAILYTSGTTGRSKGAVLTHRNLASNCQALLETWEYTSEDKLIHALPIFHIHGLFVAANMTLAAGASMYYLPKFDAEAIIDLLPRATVLMGVPTFYTRLMKDERLTAESCAQMRLFVSGSAPLPASDHEAFEARTGHAILERYGMTETGMNTTNPYRDGERRPGTVGMPLPGVEVRVVNRETARQVPQGEAGLVEVRGPNVFSGYWQMPEKTASEFRDDGFFITGDLGRIDDGYLCIVGRDKDLVISGGYNVYPKEIEEHIDAHPDVLESAVIGVAHPDLGEAVVAVVVPKDQGSEQGTGQPEAEEVSCFIADDLARFKQPRAVRLVDALPRNVMGKVQKAELRKQFADLFATAAQ